MSKLVPPADKIGLISLSSFCSNSLLQSKNILIDLSNLSSYHFSSHLLLVFMFSALGWCITWHKMLHSRMPTPLYFHYSSFIGCQDGVMFMNHICGFLWILKLSQYYFEKYVFHSFYILILVLEVEFWIYLIAILVLLLVFHLKLFINTEFGVHPAFSGLEGAVSSADHYS